MTDRWGIKDAARTPVAPGQEALAAEIARQRQAAEARVQASERREPGGGALRATLWGGAVALVIAGAAIGWANWRAGGDAQTRIGASVAPVEDLPAAAPAVPPPGSQARTEADRAAPVELAQAEGARQQPAAANWRLRCGDRNDARTCNINQELFLNRTVEGQTRQVGRILNLTVVYLDTDAGERRPFMSLQMPLGVDLRPGAVMRVDEGAEVALEFLRCTDAGCDASTPLTAGLLGQMRAGNALTVGFRGWGAEQVTAVQATLTGFTAAFEQLR